MPKGFPLINAFLRIAAIIIVVITVYYLRKGLDKVNHSTLTVLQCHYLADMGVLAV